MDKIKIELEALITEREGMVAENARRIRIDNAVAYGDEAFQHHANRIRKLGEDKEETGEVVALTLRDRAGERGYAYKRVLKLIAERQARITKWNDVYAGVQAKAKWNGMEAICKAVREWAEEEERLICSP